MITLTKYIARQSSGRHATVWWMDERITSSIVVVFVELIRLPKTIPCQLLF